MVGESAISDRIAIFWAPGISMLGKDSGFTAGIPQELRAAHNIIPQTVIPRRHQSLGATERRHRLLGTIIGRAFGLRKPNNLPNKEWGDLRP